MAREKSNFLKFSTKFCISFEDILNYLNINFHEKILKIGFFLAQKRRTSGFVSLARTPSYDMHITKCQCTEFANAFHTILYLGSFKKSSNDPRDLTEKI